MSKVALIFGVTGQCGYYLSSLLLSKGYKVIGVKRRSSTNNTYRLTSLLLSPNFKLIEGDITDHSSVFDCFNQAYKLDIHRANVEVYNLAAQSHVHTSFIQPSYTFEVNTKGVVNILEALRHFNDAKFLQYSTSEMFGSNYDSKTIGGKEYKFQSETTKFRPVSPYAVAKLAAHELVRNYRESYDLFASAIIMFNTESPLRGESFVTKKITSWLGQCYRAELSNQNYPYIQLGNIESYRDWSFCGDSQSAAYTILQQSKPNDYVVATGETHSVSEFLHKAIEMSGLDIAKLHSRVQFNEDLKRPSEVDYLCGNSEKIMKECGWRPTVNFVGLIKLMLDYEKNGIYSR